MRPSLARTVVAGVAAGLALAATMLLTFRLIGFGWDGDGVLLDPSRQSDKLIAVWTRLEPLPLITTAPASVLLGLVLFGVGHAFIYRWLSPSWPVGVVARAARLSALVFFLSFGWFEFFTPINLFGEPFSLVVVQLVFWAATAASDALVVAAIMEGRGAFHRSRRLN